MFPSRALLLFLLLTLLAPPVLAQTPDSPAAPAPPQAADLAALAEEARGWLAELLRLDTTNPPGNELAAARYLAGILEREGIAAEVLESAPGRGIVVARLRSSPVPDPARALLLVGHTDVVGVQPGGWSVNPFGGEVRTGYLYGRGALDDKGMVVAHLAVMVALKRAAVPLSRDVIFLAVADKESGGEHGMGFAIRNHWEKIAAGYALNESGYVRREGGAVRYVAVQASEKVPVRVELVATGDGGHGAVPTDGNAIARLSAALAKLSGYEAPVKLLAVTQRFFEGLAPVADGDTSRWIRALSQPARAELAAKRLSNANPAWGAMMRNTVTPTRLAAGVAGNVAPSEARATLDVRLLPGESLDALLEELKKLVDDPQVRFEPGQPLRQPAPASELDSELYRTIERVSARVFPGAPVVPLLSAEATDSAHLRLRNVQAYGLLPFPLEEEDLRRIHGDDERIPLDAFAKGVEYLYAVVETFVRAR